MLQPVFARSGSDVRGFIEKKVRELLSQDGRRVLLLVPEQASFETEKQMVLSLGDRDFAQVEVASFTRLCRLIEDRFGRRCGERLSSAGKMILAAGAVEQAAPMLRLYAGQSGSAAFVQQTSALIDELKNAGVSPEVFSEKIEQASEGDALLRDKLQDLATLYGVYDAALGRGHLDPADALSAALERVGDGRFFADFDVIISDFASFNSTQYAMIGKMLENSRSVTVLLCCAPFQSGHCPMAFRTPQDTLRRLSLRAQEAGAQVLEPLVLPAGELYENESMRTLERALCAEAGDKGQWDEVRLFSAGSVKEECRCIAAQIRHLTMTEGLRYRDIVVIGRDMEDYRMHLEDSFRLYGIPFFEDARSALDSRPCVVLVVSLLEALISDLEPSSVVRYLKCGVGPVDVDEAVLLENYIDLWRLTRRELSLPFEKNPDGLAGDPDEAALVRLNQLNDIRQRALTPLFALKRELSGADGVQITRRLYRFMQKSGALKKLSCQTQQLEEQDSALAGEQARAFAAMLNVFSQLASLLPNSPMPLKRYLELFRMALNVQDVGSIPHHLDEVQIGDAGRIRTDGARVVFLCGVCEGRFPKRFSEEGFFTDAERRRVRQSGLDILAPIAFMTQNEHYYLYRALTCASRSVYVSYSTAAVSGEATFSSKIVRQLEQATGQLCRRIDTLEPSVFFGTDAADFQLLCEHFHGADSLSATLRQYFTEKAPAIFRQRLARIEDGLRLRQQELTPAAAQRLYGRELAISPTQIERYHLCRFSHFCRYGLGLVEQRAAEIGALDTGSAIHAVLEQMLSHYSRREIAAFDEQRMEREVEQQLYDFLSRNIGTAAMQNPRIRYSIMRLKSTLVPVLRYIIRELETSGFTPQDFELPIRHGGAIEPYRMVSEQGTAVSVYGNVDRVDTLQADGKTYVRVIDYKSGGKDFNRGELSWGLNLQMFLYLFSIWENGGSHYSGSLTPSGVLYMPAKRPDVPAAASAEETALEQEKKFRMKGLLLEDAAIRDGDSDRRFCSAAYESLSEFEALKNQTERLLLKMADELRFGHLEVNPLYAGRENRACAFCPYHIICGFEEGDPHPCMQKKKKGETQDE